MEQYLNIFVVLMLCHFVVFSSAQTTAANAETTTEKREAATTTVTGTTTTTTAGNSSRSGLRNETDRGKCFPQFNPALTKSSQIRLLCGQVMNTS